VRATANDPSLIVRLVLALAVVMLGASSCSLRLGRPPPQTVETLRIREVVDEGDPARRASTRLVLKGLDADVQNRAERALASYEEALRVDATNPYAYLAIARHRAAGEDPDWALSFIDKAESLFRAEGGPSPRVEPHLVGLRGQALYASGQIDSGLPLLEQAWTVAPEVWMDGQLSADELR
jgi:tetratricopeptide (TPR) repeat protein